MIINQTMETQVEAEFEIVVKRADGSIKEQLPVCKNLITNNGLKLLNSGSATTKGGVAVNYNTLFTGCLVGTGSNNPTVLDTTLTNFVSYHSSTIGGANTIEAPTAILHPKLVKVSSSRKFIFTDINNENITEVGLGAKYNNTDYSLFTHALIRDNSGTPVAITVLKGELLEITYTVHSYFNIAPMVGTFTLTTTTAGVDTTSKYKYVINLYSFSNLTADAGVSLPLPNYINLYTYGCKETPADIVAMGGTYDVVNKWKNIINSSDFSHSTVHTNVANLTNGYLNSGSGGGAFAPLSSWSKQQNVLGAELISMNGEETIVKYAISPYNCNHPNGIRAVSGNLAPADSRGSICYYTIAFENLTTGLGIPKNNTMYWAFSLRTAVTRYTGP